MINILPLANLVVPLFLEFYTGLFFCCIIVVPFEAYIFKYLEKISYSKILLYVFLANIASWIIGIIISAFLMSMIEYFTFSSDPDKERVLEWFVAFIIAFFLSWLIESLFLKCFQKRLLLTKPFKTTFYANMFSYLIIYIIYFGGIIIEGLLS